MKAHILLRTVIAVGICLTVLALDGMAQTLDLAGIGEDSTEDEGGQIFARSCTTCHSTAQSGRTPSRFSLAQLTPRAIVAALEDDVMRAEGVLSS